MLVVFFVLNTYSHNNYFKPMQAAAAPPITIPTYEYTVCETEIYNVVSNKNPTIVNIIEKLKLAKLIKFTIENR